jgi:hypothetical protein
MPANMFMMKVGMMFSQQLQQLEVSSGLGVLGVAFGAGASCAGTRISACLSDETGWLINFSSVRLL